MPLNHREISDENKKKEELRDSSFILMSTSAPDARYYYITATR